MTMTTTKKKSPTEKARQQALAEIGARIKQLDSGEVAPSGEPAPVAVAAAGSPVPPKGGKKAAKGGKPAKAAPKPEPKPAKEPKAKKEPSKLSGLDAAAKILAEAKKPLNCKELVAAAFKQNLWRSEGATPDATLSAAIGREIRAKGGDSRFVKKGRGQFAAAKGA